MSNKQFTLEQWTKDSLYFSDGEYSAHMSIEYICKEVEKKLNEQQDRIIYWKHKVYSLLWILGQFDEAKVKELLKELDNEL